MTQSKTKTHRRTRIKNSEQHTSCVQMYINPHKDRGHLCLFFGEKKVNLPKMQQL